MGWLYAEARAAAAARRRIGVGHLERRATQILDIIDRRSADEIEAYGIDHEGHAVGLGDNIILFDRFGQGEAVSESGTAAAIDREAQHRRLRLAQGDRRDTLGSVWG